MADEHAVARLYSQRYNTGIEMLAQQFVSMTDGTVREESQDGERAFYDQAGIVRMVEKTGVAIDVPRVETPTDRRSLVTRDFYLRDFIDSFDKLKVLNDPTNAFATAQAAAAMRQRDKVVIDAAIGTAYKGKSGTEATELPTDHVIAAGGTGFTLDKLKRAVRTLKTKNALMPGERPCVLWTSAQEEEFLNVNEVKSVDFNREKVLTEGKLDNFYGTDFKRIEDISQNAEDRMLPIDGSNVRSCIMYIKRGVLRGTWRPPRGRVDYIAERDSYQVMTALSVGATRMQEVMVVRIDCTETPLT